MEIVPETEVAPEADADSKSGYGFNSFSNWPLAGL